MRLLRKYELNWLASFVISVLLSSQIGLASESFEIKTGLSGTDNSTFVVQKLNNARREIHFSVKANSSARVTLLGNLATTRGLIKVENQNVVVANLTTKIEKGKRLFVFRVEVEIGASNNSQVLIRINQKIEANATVDQVLSGEEYRNFSIAFDEDQVVLRRLDETLLTWSNNNNKTYSVNQLFLSNIGYIGFTTLSSSKEASWMLSSQDFNTASPESEMKKSSLTEIATGDWRFVHKRAIIRKLKKSDPKRLTLGVKAGGLAHIFLLSNEIVEDIENYNVLTATVPNQTDAAKLNASDDKVLTQLEQNLATWPKKYIEIVLGEPIEDKDKTINLKGGYQNQFWDYTQMRRDVISDKEFRYFWIELNGTSIEIGIGSLPLLTSAVVAHLKHKFTITHIGLSTSSGSGSWLIPKDEFAGLQSVPDIDSYIIDSCDYKPTYRNPGYWSYPDVSGDVPVTAQPSYDLQTDQNVFVGRVQHDGAISPGKIQWRGGISFAAADGERTEKLNYQIFIRNSHLNYTWVPGDNENSVPSGALQGGVSHPDGLPVYICRHKGNPTHIGVLLPNGKCRVPSGSKTVILDSYELLVVKKILLSASTKLTETRDDAKAFQCRYNPVYRHPVVWRDMKYVNKSLPLKAVSAGIGVNGGDVYICRAWLNIDEMLQIGVMIPSREKPCTLINPKDKQVTSNNYQVLVKDKHTLLRWEPVTNKQTPNGAIQGGVSDKKNPLFVCRCFLKSHYYVGSAKEGDACVVYFESEVQQCVKFQILAARSVSLWEAPQEPSSGISVSLNSSHPSIIENADQIP